MQRFQTRILLEKIPPETSPALVDGLPKGGQRFLLLTAQCVDFYVSDPVAISNLGAEGFSMYWEAAAQQQVCPTPAHQSWIGPNARLIADPITPVPIVDLRVVFAQPFGKSLCIQISGFWSSDLPSDFMVSQEFNCGRSCESQLFCSTVKDLASIFQPGGFVTLVQMKE